MLVARLKNLIRNQDPDSNSGPQIYYFERSFWWLVTCAVPFPANQSNLGRQVGRQAGTGVNAGACHGQDTSCSTERPRLGSLEKSHR